MSYTHGKDPSQNDATDEGGVAVTESEPSTTTSTTTTAEAITTTTEYITTTEPYVNTTRRPYPLEPSTIQAATAYSLFSDPEAFTLNSIYKKTHYLTPTLKGKIWWDINSDGKRGDWTNATLNADEYDHGIPNVNRILLVTCNDDGNTSELGSTRSMPYNDREPIPLRQSVVPEAGIYEFNELNTIPSGRYYVMYQSPMNWRMSGNSLPLNRKRIESEEGEEYYECVPEGGNGVKFSDMARETGDFDYEGYCSRSIGCLEVGTKEELENKFEKLTMMEDTDYYENVVQGDTEEVNAYSMTMGDMGGKWVAMPSEDFMDVGMAEAVWPLAAEQYADATVTLQIPVTLEERRLGVTKESPLMTLLEAEFATSQSFGTSMNKKQMKTILDKYLRDNIGNLESGGNLKSESKMFAEADSESEKIAGEKNKNNAEIFALSGVDLFDAKIEKKKKPKRDAIIDYLQRYLRGSRSLQEEGEEDEEVIEITYTFTARGSYNPPPHEQLGFFVQNSINADPDELVRALREDPILPYHDLDEASSSHLTVGPPAPKLCVGCFGILAVESEADSGGMKKWATIPVALLSVMIGGLIFLFLGRRVFKRRREVDGFDVQQDMQTMAFSVNNVDIEKEKLEELRKIAGDAQEGEEDQDSSKRGKKKKRKSKKKPEREGSFNSNSIGSAASGESNPQGPHVEENDSDSSNDSEGTEARRRRRRKERRAQRKAAKDKEEQDDDNENGPPTLEDLNRKKKKKKHRSVT